MKYLNKIFLSLTFLCFINSNSLAEVVNEVKVKGNNRITLETIVIFGDISLGKNYESSDINSLIKKLYDTTYFSNISVELKNGILSLTVEENPIINEIEFKGEKAEKYSDAIRELLSLREKTSFINNYVKSDINKIKEFYRLLGFFFVKIDAEVQNLDKNRVNLIYSIEKGEKAKISKIYFLGDKKIRDKKLRDIITSQESAFWKLISRNVYLNKSRVELDKRLLKNYYRNKGYYEVIISSSNVEYSEGDGFVLTFSINAGKRYKFSKIFVNVAPSLDQSAFVSLEKEFTKVIGDYYSQKKLTEILGQIDKLSEQKELQFINHKVTETLDGDMVDVKIDVFEGEKFLIERINIAGNNVTNDSVIRGELLVDEGDPYSKLLVSKSINKLKARGIFGDVKEEIFEGSTPDLKILNISVEEKATGEIAAGAGVGTDGTSFMFAVSENNWLGRGVQLDTSVEVTQETLRGGISIRNPNYNFSNNAVFTSLNLASEDRTTSSGYESSTTGFELGTEFEQYENIYFSPSLNASYEKIDVQTTASSQMKKMEGTFSNIDFSYGVAADKRNQAFQPTAGYYAKFQQSLPIILDSASILNGIDVSHYYAYSDDIVGKLSFYGRTISGVGDDVRVTKRLYLPPKKLRGFNTRRVGPKDGGDWVGGNFNTAINYEAMLPNLLPESYKTDVSIFVDTGNVWSVDYSSSVQDTNQIRSAVGITANVFTTVGPLSFTLAQDLSKSENDETETFNFRLGTSF